MEEICITITSSSRKSKQNGEEMDALSFEIAGMGKMSEKHITFNSGKRGKGIRLGFRKGV